IDLRFPVQYVVRPDLNFRGFAGTIESGVLRKGDEIVAIPSGKRSKVKSIVTFDGELDQAFAPMSITVALEDEIDISRGDMIVHPNNAPRLDNTIEAMVVWMSEKPLDPGGSYLVNHSTVQTPATVSDVVYKMDVNTLRREDTNTLQLNEIGRLRFETMRPLAYDAYTRN
ncbi:MAG: bifunctional sulfate adenylyltransferase subunit 1/adenylylsulfate kinase, partial [Pseudomonadales bacterium]|nr:bifunctional sulfate adenylyltransferase subunit 1/adenylylsulfate kinase [Pseudomonadales bacterium]